MKDYRVEEKTADYFLPSMACLDPDNQAWLLAPG